MIKRGVYAAGLSVIHQDHSLNIDATIKHATAIIQNGLHGVFFFGSTGQSQLISMSEKKELVSRISTHKLKKQFFLGTGNNSLLETVDFIKYAMEFDFNNFLIMPPAYYKKNSDEGVFNFYSSIISKIPKVKIILYNFEKLSGFEFSINFVKKLVDNFPKNIIGCKDSSYNLFKQLKLPNFQVFPGSESKLLNGLENGCAGCISAVTNVTHKLARKVFDDYEEKKIQSANDKLKSVRESFDQFNLISALHSFFSIKDDNFKNLLPPLKLLNSDEKKDLIHRLNRLKFIDEKHLAA